MRLANTHNLWRAGKRAPRAIDALLPIAAMLGLSLLTTSSASADNAPLSRRVSYAGLNLDNPKDLTTLNQRLTAAAEKVCLPESQSVALRTRRQGERCMAEAIARARIQLETKNLPSLVGTAHPAASSGQRD